MSNDMDTTKPQAPEFGDPAEVVKCQQQMFEQAQKDTVPFLSLVVEQDGDRYKAMASGAHFDGQKALFFIEWMADQFNLSIAAIVNAIEIKRHKEIKRVTEEIGKRGGVIPTPAEEAKDA